MVIFHVIALGITFALVFYADEQAFQYVRGRIHTLHAGKVRFLHYGVALGLAAVMITGGLMYIGAPQYYLSETVFLVKMIAVAALILNSVFIERFSARAAAVPFAAHTKREQQAFLLSGAVSVLGWATALACGLLL